MKYYFLGLGVLVAVCVGCAGGGSSNVSNMFDKGEYAAPPAAMMMRPGPAVDGPGPGVLNWPVPAPAAPQQRTTQVRFVEPQTMRVGWQVGNRFAENQIVVPGRYNFIQGNTYRLKLTGMPNREGETLYPTLQVYPGQPQTDAYLTHNSIPIELTIDDLDQVAAGNFVTKVIYLPDPKFQDLAIGDVETLVSTRLAPGVDPVVEADKRGTIMAVLRVGNFDYEMPTAFGTPQAPGPQGMPAPGNSGPGPDAPGPMLSNPNGGNLTTMNYDGEVQQVQYQNQQSGIGSAVRSADSGRHHEPRFGWIRCARCNDRRWSAGSARSTSDASDRRHGVRFNRGVCLTPARQSVCQDRLTCHSVETPRCDRTRSSTTPRTKFRTA